ncbi:type IIL restriction-modification enzyme MmeI [Sinorhizobium sp. NFACC03]|uniref:Eco57I restriction-modification methylase domain-containing protein n=1 Tax=Sinorhizobium sp. NFACC03 TaxID=1566295 RepID=UPI0008919FB6|nr:type IIL restriction-modification enzyme MmeI [Sinorhizobium sp. NFACC03]SDA86080.1 hypothetical protein SAMN03159448_03784 [Sinorhizobium sp. NFACC03]
MSYTSQHSEWLSLIEVSGPFLAEPVLKEAFPQGLEGLDGTKKKTIRQAYDEWREAIDLDDPDALRIHDAWITFVLRQGLELDEDGSADVLKSGTDLPSIGCELPEHVVTLMPDFVVVDGQSATPLMLIAAYEPQVVLSEAFKQGTWSASPGERMVELCRAAGVRLGLVTNGEQWMLVDAPVGAVTTFASWYGRLWAQEPITLQAFVSLLGIRRFFVDRSEQLPALLDNSLKYQDEVTDALGEQVRRAVEVLIQALDRAHVDSNRTLLEGVEPTDLYEAGLTVMMRIVFLLSAEERGLLLMGDELYEANYAVSTLRSQLLTESPEVLEKRWDAWSRLLSLFRAVYGGIDHEALRLPAMGGSLFDPDRFPFLEGRPRGSNWKADLARPLPIDNRTVLLLLEAVQLFRGRTLSYMALDVEQIGYVYEGLLERTVKRANEVTLDLDATKDALNPWATLPEVENASARGPDALEQLFKERTESSASRIRSDLHAVVDDDAVEKLLAACHADRALRDRVKPYFHLLRTDPWGYPLVYPKGTFMVASGSDRRETGTHYTPKSFTEAIVRDTLEPLVYSGPSTGATRDEWQLKSPSELLNLKVCDPAMGSGAFLVQVCRFLSERLTEAWSEAETAGKTVTSKGEVVDDSGACEPLPRNSEERLVVARRLIAERCLYGVDMNPLAVELAKLSIWLVTLAKGRPFGFLDHNLRCGDSLLGITDITQLIAFDLKSESQTTRKLFAARIDTSVNEAIELRSSLRETPIRDIRDIEAMASLDMEVRRKLQIAEAAADALVAEAFKAQGHKLDTTALSIEVGLALEGNPGTVELLQQRAMEGLNADSREGKKPRRPFHWPLEFPEVFVASKRGFDALVGNPPFLGDTRMKKALGSSYRKYITNYISCNKKGKADLVVFFYLRGFEMLAPGGFLGLLGTDTISHGDSRVIGFDQIASSGGTIYNARTSLKWPGKASIVVHQVFITRQTWAGSFNLNNTIVDTISTQLHATDDSWLPKTLASNLNLVFEGTAPNGEGFLVSAEWAAATLRERPEYADILYPYIIAKQVNQNPDHSTDRWIINFWDWSEERSAAYNVAFSVIEDTVKPVRQRRDENGEFVLRAPIPQKWWQHKERRPALYHAIGRGRLFESHPRHWLRGDPMPQVIVMARGATKYPCFTLLPNHLIFGDSLCVIAKSNYSTFAVLSSDIHAIWAWRHGGRKESRLRYTQESIFETFPFPSRALVEDPPQLAEIGRRFFEARQKYMITESKGMTDFYNDLHDVRMHSEAVEALRKLQIELNDAVIVAYGFGDVDLEYGFHEVNYLPIGENLRFTVSERARAVLLVRLNELNRIQYQLQLPPTSVRGDEIDEVGLFALGGSA